MLWQDMVEDIKSEMSGHCEDVLVALVEGVAKFLARQVHDAISGAGTDEQILIDILCPRTNNEIADISDAYLERKYTFHSTVFVLLNMAFSIRSCYSATCETNLNLYYVKKTKLEKKKNLLTYNRLCTQNCNFYAI